MVNNIKNGNNSALERVADIHRGIDSSIHTYILHR